jgi:two-component system sensor histidine kinase QseC
LTAISTHLQVAAMSEGAGLREALADAGEGVRRLQATLDQLLLLARVEGSVPFDEADAIAAEEAVRRASSVTAAAGRRVRCEVASGGILLAVPAELAVVAVRNLLDNALRYSPAQAEVVVRVAADPDMVEVRVRDRGAGLHRDAHHRARERFWRGGSGEGSGFGLTIVEAIARRYGGSIGLRSASDGGTEAVLRMPRLDARGPAR